MASERQEFMFRSNQGSTLSEPLAIYLENGTSSGSRVDTEENEYEVEGTPLGRHRSISSQEKLVYPGNAVSNKSLVLY